MKKKQGLRPLNKGRYSASKDDPKPKGQRLGLWQVSWHRYLVCSSPEPRVTWAMDARHASSGTPVRGPQGAPEDLGGKPGESSNLLVPTVTSCPGACPSALPPGGV